MIGSFRQLSASSPTVAWLSTSGDRQRKCPKKRVLTSRTSPLRWMTVYDPDADFDSDSSVNFGDLARLKQTFFNGPTPGPGPSALPNDCE